MVPALIGFVGQRRSSIIFIFHTLYVWEYKGYPWSLSFLSISMIMMMNKEICFVFLLLLSSHLVLSVVFLLLTHSHWSPPPPPRAALWLVQPNCWWDAERQDCIPCRCSPHGSMSQRCDIEGRCICRPGFVGRHCDLRRQGYERRETRRPVERVPIEAVQQRWGGSSRTGGCPRGAYRPKTGVTHMAWCVLRRMVVYLLWNLWIW